MTIRIKCASLLGMCMNPEFLSGEASASPAVDPMLVGARRLDKAGFGDGLLSARNGPRTTTHAQVPFGMLQAGDFVEIADYDPHLDRTLCIGRREPHPFGHLHALVYRAKKEVGAIAMVALSAEAPARVAQLPHVERQPRPLESALAVLEALRGRDAVRFDRFVFVTGRDVNEALSRAGMLLGA